MYVEYTIQLFVSNFFSCNFYLLFVKLFIQRERKYLPSKLSNNIFQCFNWKKTDSKGTKLKIKNKIEAFQNKILISSREVEIHALILTASLINVVNIMKSIESYK